MITDRISGAAQRLLAPRRNPAMAGGAPTLSVVPRPDSPEPDLAAQLAGPGPWRLPGLLSHPDGHLRHQRLARAVRAEHRSGTVLNVGDPFCQLRDELSGFEVTSTDVMGPLVKLDADARFLKEDFTADTNPFGRASYDIVCSTDTLEHIPADRRRRFLGRTAEIARKSVYLAFPAGADARAAESVIRSSRTKINFRDALEEHSLYGLPEIADVAADLDALGLEHEIRPLTTVGEWLTSFVFSTVDNEDDALVSSLWQFLNRSAPADPGAGPVYRHLVIVRH